jgi:hypothetical protein
MFGDGRKAIKFFAVLLVFAHRIFISAFLLSTTLITDQHYSAEAFVSVRNIQKATRRSALPRSSVLLRNMSSRRDNDYDSTVPGDNKRRMQGNNGSQEQPQKQPRRREATTGAAPMYITIGPQCCGKSSFLRDYKEGKIKDISLDDQKDVYVPIATETFLRAYDEAAKGSTANAEEQEILQQVYQGKTLSERVRENIELILILRRWNGESSASDFEGRIRSFYEERKLSRRVAEALIASVEDFLLAKPELPKETDVFVLESLFRPHPDTRQSAIQRAHEELRETPKHIPVAWGNTNSKAKDYEKALEICHQTRRPVHFVLCHPGYCGNSNKESELLTLPWVPLEELLTRNLHRLQKQGRFVPANAIADCCERVERMIPATFFDDSSGSPGLKNVEEHLVSIGSPCNTYRGPPRRNDNRRPNNAPQYRYSLSTHRLIQKQYPPRNEKGQPSHRQQQHPNNRNRQPRNYNEGRGPGPRYQNQYNDRKNSNGGRSSDDGGDRRYRDNRQRD